MSGLSAFGWALLASFCWGFAPLLEKAGLRGTVDPALGVFVRSLGVLLGALCFLPALPKISGRFADLTMRNWIFLCLGGIVASIIGQLCFYRALKTGEVSRVVPIGASYPVLAFLLGTLFLGESINLAKVGGIVLVMVGVYLLR
jgi:bacterial/archaeal transporter family protein